MADFGAFDLLVSTDLDAAGAGEAYRLARVGSTPTSQELGAAVVHHDPEESDQDPASVSVAQCAPR